MSFADDVSLKPQGFQRTFCCRSDGRFDVPTASTGCADAEKLRKPISGPPTTFVLDVQRVVVCPWGTL